MTVPITRYFNPTLEVSVLDTTVRFQDAQGLKIVFRVTRTMTPAPDTAEISIFNMAPERAKKMAAVFSATGRAEVTLRAGYDRALFGLFKGQLRRFDTALRNGPDVVTRIIADDGGDDFADVKIRIPTGTLSMTAQNMIDIATKTLGWDQHPSVAQILAASDPRRTGPYSFSPVGKATDLLDAAARRCRCRWWMRDNVLYLGFKGQATLGQAVLVNQDTLTDEPSFDGSGLVHIPTLMDPNVAPGGQVFHSGRNLRVETVTHQGDTRGLFTSSITGRVLEGSTL